MLVGYAPLAQFLLQGFDQRSCLRHDIYLELNPVLSIVPCSVVSDLHDSLRRLILHFIPLQDKPSVDLT